jgi:hypothetical protein
LARVGDRLRIALFGLLAERLRGQRVDRVVEVVVDFRDQPANERARAHVAGKQRRSGRRESFVQILDDRVRLVEHEIIVDDRRHAVPRIERQNSGLRVSPAENESTFRS